MSHDNQKPEEKNVSVNKEGSAPEEPTGGEETSNFDKYSYARKPVDKKVNKRKTCC
jgi:hypothetical protein